MRYLIIVLFCCLLETTISRPQAMQDYKDVEEAEYEDEDSPEDSPHGDEDAALDERANNKEGDEVTEPHQKRNYFFKHHAANRSPEERTVKENTNENFSEFKKSPDEDAAESDRNQQATNKRSDRTNEPGNPRNPFIQALVNQKENRILRNLLNKRRDNAMQEESNDMLYENDSNDSSEEHVSKNDKNKRNEDSSEHIGQSNYYNHYGSRPQTKDKESEDGPYEEISAEDANRDRRDTKDPDETNNGNTNDNKEKKDLDNLNVSEQSIIQRYVKKLNKKEVRNLMRTLSDEKRAILKQIIGSDGSSNEEGSLNKREITKKAEAVEENNFMEGIQSDSNKISGPLVNFNMAGAITDKDNDPTGSTPAVVENLTSTKVSESKVNKRSSEEAVSEKSENGAVTTTSSESARAKSANKREVNVEEPHNDNLNMNELQEPSLIGSQDELYASSQDEDLSQLMEDDDGQLHYDYHNPQKRDLLQENNENLAESIKSLRESFSDNNNYENSGYTGDSNMMPLIRVKRKNYEHAVKKRAAAIFPESKVAYVPENEDEDNDEGNEIYDNGFFDRTASFAKSNKRLSDSRESALKLTIDDNTGNVFKRSSVEDGHAADVDRDPISIGSDTDGVLSGIEGVNDNLMYNGGCRRKRATEEITKLEPVDDIIKGNNATRSSLMADIARPEIFGVSLSGNYAYGSPSKSYDGELGRYKRIRRLKQQSAIKILTTKAVS